MHPLNCSEPPGGARVFVASPVRPPALVAAGMLALLGVFNACAYEVWMGTHLMRHSDATNLADWSMVASQLEGFNVNRAPHDTDPASNDDWRTIFAQFTRARRTGTVMTEVARSTVTRNPALTNELAFAAIDETLSRIFGYESIFGYDLNVLMFYDERGTYQGNTYLYTWTAIEAQHMREWLDTHGHADVRLMWDARNNSQANRDWAVHPVVDDVMIEASTTELLGNRHNQITFAKWFWTNPATANKRLVFQIPRSEDSLTQYQGTRRVVKLLGEELGYDDNGIRSRRLVIQPVTYNDNYAYLPETTSGGTAYANRLTSICLSLIEQRSLFEGRSRLPTNADADSTTRLFGPTVSFIADQVLPANTGVGPLEFTIADDLTPPSQLTLIKESSNTNLVPLANIVLGGSGAHRTVTVTPAAGQSGSSVIRIWVSDGTLATPVSFTFTVLPPGIISGTLYSDLADSAPRRQDGQPPSILAGTARDATLYAGRGGTGGSVDRCIIFPFKLPALGMKSAPFTSASFSFHLVANDFTSTGCNLDLYGLPNRAEATVLATDYYSETDVADPAPGALRLQDNICTPASTPGLYTNSPAGRSALLNYLNAQYAGGANAGKYVFLRLNKDAYVGTSPRKYIVTAADGASTNNAGQPDYLIWPRIEYTAQAANTAPTLAPIPNRTLIAGQWLVVTNIAADADVPPQTLTFGLINPVAGASINPSNGVITWRPAIAQSPSINLFRVTVTDNGSPSLSATQSFLVTVRRPLPPVIRQPGVADSSVHFFIHGDNGPDYTVQASTNLMDWISLWTNSTSPPWQFTDPDSSRFPRRFYRVLLGP